MTERDPLRVFGSIALVLALIGAAVVATSGGATATMSQLSISGDSITTDDGTVNDVGVDVSVVGSYDGVDQSAEQLRFALQTYKNGKWHTVATKVFTVKNRGALQSHAGKISASFDASLVNNSPWSASDFAASADGSTAETVVDYRVVMVVENGDGSNIASATSKDKVKYTVTNEATSTTAGGSGQATSSGTNQAY